MRVLTSLILAILVALAPSAQAAGCTCGPEAPRVERSCACCGEAAGAAGCDCCGEQDRPTAGWDSCDCVQVQPVSGPEAADEIVPETLESGLPVEAGPHGHRKVPADSFARAVLPPGFLLPLLV
jgi:hypothetical protein